jgi:hypothetical protein
VRVDAIAPRSEFVQKCTENESTVYNFLGGRRDRPPTGDKAHANYLRPHRNVRVVLFGVFTSERIDMPRKPACNAKLLTHSMDEFWGDPCTFADCIDIASNLADNFKLHFLPNHYRDDPVPPPPLQFYAYLLREHFNMQFGDTVFSMRPGVGGAYFDFKWNGGIFGDPIEGVARSIGLEILQKYTKPEVEARFLPMIMVPRPYERPPGSF